MYKLLLALPFAIGVAVLQGLTIEIDTFHGSDAAVYQLPTIELFRERLDFSDYPSAQTPLYHVVTAAWGKLVGFELWKLRLLNVAISYGAALALLRLLSRATPLGPRPAFALTLAFVLSPYFFGASFTLLTDNLAILFALLALERVYAFSRSGSMAAFALAALGMGAAVLTRQSFVWLFAVAAFFLLRRSDSPGPRRSDSPGARGRAGPRRSDSPGARGRAGPRRSDSLREVLLGSALLALALVPLALLVIEWNGLVPPSADPASCGLCTERPGFGRDTLTLRTVGFTVALLGVYAALLLGPSAWGWLRVLRSPAGRLARDALGSPAGRALSSFVTGKAPRRLDAKRLLILAAAGALALLLLSPLEYVPVLPDRPGDAGWLWKVSDQLPTLLGSSLVFWLLVPLGALAAAVLGRRAGWASLPSVFLGAFLVAALPVALVYQKYFDPFMLLAVALFARPMDFRRSRDYAGIAVICVASVAYALSFAF